MIRIQNIVCAFVLLAFVVGSVPLQAADLVLSPSGQMVALSPAFIPAAIKGMKVYPDKPLRFDFVIDTGNENLSGDKLQGETTRLIRYFLAALTVPEEDTWVNLSPYENDRIITDSFGLTEMGRDLLAEDYILKQLTASLMYPKSMVGKDVWKRIYDQVFEKYGTTDIPMDTFNKVWIIPDEATVLVHGDTAFIASSRLRVLLDADYLASKRNNSGTVQQGVDTNARAMVQQAIREVILPQIENEINTGKSFARLRQIYHAMILSVWFKRNLKRSLVGQVYVDSNKVAGIDLIDKAEPESIWRRYVEAFKKGVFSYIEEEYDGTSQELIPRKYFSGGFADNAAAVKEQLVRSEEISAAAQKGRVGTYLVVDTGFDPIGKKSAFDQSMKVGDMFSERLYQSLPAEAKTSIAQMEGVRHNDKLYIVWRAGDENGKIYKVVDIPVDLKPFERSAIVDKVAEYLPEMVSVKTRRSAELSLGEYLYGTYYGLGGGVEFGAWQFLDNGIREFIEEIEAAGGLGKWVKKLAQENGYGDLNVSFDTGKFYQGPAYLKEHQFQTDEGGGIYLSHATYAPLEQIINMGGLASPEHLVRKGIIRQSGEHGKASGVFPGADNTVSTYSGREALDTARTFGRLSSGFEMPMIFSLTFDAVLGMDLVNGSDPRGELAVRDEIPLEQVAYVFVPYFRVKEVGEIFRNHGHGHIIVKPLGYNGDDSLWTGVLDASEQQSGEEKLDWTSLYYHLMGGSFIQQNPVAALYMILNSGRISGEQGGWLSRGYPTYPSDTGKFLTLAIKGDHLKDKLVNEEDKPADWFTGTQDGDIDISESLRNGDVYLISSLPLDNPVVAAVTMELNRKKYPVRVIYRGYPAAVISGPNAAAFKMITPVALPETVLNNYKDVGGIDLNADHLRLIEAGEKMNFDSMLDTTALSQGIDGFTPVVFKVSLMGDPTVFFGATPL